MTAPDNARPLTEKEWEDRPAFALDADVTVYWPDVRPCWEDK